MDPDDAVKRLIFHAEYHSEGTGAFLEMLRPYRGMRDNVLTDVMDALRAAASIVSRDSVPRELASALWAISHLGRSWALDPGGMLRRNKLISDSDQRKLATFLEQFDYAVMTLLDGSDVGEAFSGTALDWRVQS